MTTPEAVDQFTELLDATIDRVDLVAEAANGMRFVLAKSAAPSPQEKPVTRSPALPRMQAAAPVRKADKPLPVAVYDQQGQLIGITDQSAITPVTDDISSVTKATPTSVAELKKSLRGVRGAVEQSQVALAMQTAAVATLRRIHSSRSRR